MRTAICADEAAGRIQKNETASIVKHRPPSGGLISLLATKKRQQESKRRMESTLTATGGGKSWEIIPNNAVAGIVLAVLFIYLFFRHFLFVLMVMDIVLGWLRRFAWFPKEGKRRKTLFHWIIAVVMFIGFLAVAGSAGWLQFVPQ